MPTTTIHAALAAACQSRRGALIPLSALALLFATITPGVTHSAPTSATPFPVTQEENDEPSEQQESEPNSGTVPELPSELRLWLDRVRESQVRGDLDGARTHLSALILSEEYVALLADVDDVALAGLDIIDELAEVLGLIQVQSDVREERIRRLSASLNADHRDLIFAKQGLAATRFAIGDLAGAHELFEQVHDSWKRLLPADHLDVLRAKHDLAATRKAMGDLAEAHELFELVHEAFERLLPADDPDLLAVRGNLAGTRYALGDLAGAHELDELVHEARERLLPADHPDLLRAKQNLAATRKAMGDLAGAHELFELVHAARERLLPADHPDLLAAKGNLAGTRYALGDLTGARELEELVHEAWEHLLPADHPDLLRAKQNLAATRKAMGDLAGALELFELVHRARERLLPDDHPDLLGTKQNLAATRYALGDLAGAHELFELVHEARERMLPANHPDLLRTKQNLAATRKNLGDLKGALELDELVHDAWERLLPSDHPDLLAAKQNLAGTRHALGDLNGARQLISTILRGQIQRATSLRHDAPRVARAAAEDEHRRLSACLSLSHSTQLKDARDLGGELFSALEALRSVSVGAGAVRRAAARRPELAGLLGALERARGAVSDHRLAIPSAGTESGTTEVGAWRKELFRLTEKRDGLEQRVRMSLAEAGFDPPLPTAECVAAGLPPAGVLIDYLRYEKRGQRDPSTGKYSPSINSLLAFVLTPDGKVTRIELGASDELEHQAMQWRELIGKPIERGFSIALQGESETEVGSKLRARLLDPCLAVLGDATPTELYIILDDFLHPVPMNALPWRDGRRLGEVFDVRLEQSAQRLAEQAAPFHGDGLLLAMGGVDFTAKNISDAAKPYLTATPPTGESYRSDRSNRPGSYEPLIQTMWEVETLGLMHKDLAGGESIILTGAAASKKALFEHAPSVRYLHLATHGWFAPEAFVSTTDSLEQQSSDAFAMFSRADATVRGFAPETLCGLALAGANNGVNSSGRVPGIITAEELGALNLSNCELAVLSACETNVGLRRAGQGIQSLQTALHTAGVRTAITSLWKVDDAATRRLMELFYTKLWSEKLGKADALWQAKMALREEGLGVKDWAAWVLTGDPR